MDKLKKNPQLIIILAILFITGLVFTSKFNAVKPTASNRVLADEGEDRDEVEEKDDEDRDDDEDKEDNEDKDDEEDKDDNEEDSKKEQDDDDEDDVDYDADENDDEDESGEEIKDISELIAKVEGKIEQVAAQGGSITEFNVALDEVRNLVAQAQTKLESGDKVGAENLIETADDKLENLEESVKLVLGELDDDEENEADDDEDDSKTRQAKEYKNFIARLVHALKETAELEGVDKGIGSTVSVIAQTQNLSSERVANRLDKIAERDKFTKFLVGPDLDNLKGIEEEIAKNKATVDILRSMLTETDNANVITILNRQIQWLEQENAKLENYVASTENTPSLFGWIVRLFS